MKMRRPEGDIALADRLGYMVEDTPYQNHVASAHETKEVYILDTWKLLAHLHAYLKQKSSCQNHCAVNQANVNRSILQATGIGATACARHGCFLPHSVVNFYKGEQYVSIIYLSENDCADVLGFRQKNIDYSICQALSYNSAGISKALIIYDVACQWYVKFPQRVEMCPALEISQEMDIVPVVGNFHLSAHKLECFACFSPMFMQGAGHIDGEILKTLWAPFNKISATARSMSMAHRQKVYDDYMRDSNWKKLVGIGLTSLPVCKCV